MPHPGGTCPGDGRCDGTGGSSACSGCPTFNNTLNARLVADGGAPADDKTPVVEEPIVEDEKEEAVSGMYLRGYLVGDAYAHIIGVSVL